MPYVFNFRSHWGPADNYPPPRRGQNRQTYRSPKAATNMKSSRGGGKGGGGGKPPKKGGLCVQVAPYAAWPALLMLGNAIWQSLG